MSWARVERVLAIRLDAMGDVLMTGPAIRALRATVPHLTLLTSAAGAAVAALMPGIDETLVYAAPWMKASGDAPVASDFAMIDTLRAGRFDAAVVFTVFSQTPFPAAMLTRLAGIPRVLMYARERAYGLASDVVVETEPESGIRHEVQRHLDLVAEVGCTVRDDRMQLKLPEVAWERAANVAPAQAGASLGGECTHPVSGPCLRRDDGQRWAVIHPGASAPSRRWPTEYYAKAVRLLTAEGWRCVLTGDANEAALCSAIIAGSGADAVNLAGQLDLPTLAALIGLAPLVIANNTGPAHIAAAMGTPVVVPYALTNPQHTPWGVPSRVLSQDVDCRWCFASVCKSGHHLCLRGVTPAQVVAAVLDLTALSAAA